LHIKKKGRSMESANQSENGPKLRPFHETIVDAIRRCSSPSTGEIIRLFALIEQTEIPEGHDEIIAAIDEFFGFSGGEKWAYDIRRVKESILAQKEKSKTKPEREEK